MSKQHTSVILRNTNILEISSLIHFKGDVDVGREDFRLLKQYSNNITSISQHDDIVTIGIWFDSKEEADEFIKKMDKLSPKSN